MWHKLCYQQPLISFAATPNQIRQSLTSQCPNRPCFLEELARIGPGQLVEALDSDPTVAVVVELALVHNVGGFLAVLGDYVVGGEAGRGGFELVEAELGKARARIFVGFAAPILEVGGFEDGGFKVGVEPAERESGAAGSH